MSRKQILANLAQRCSHEPFTRPLSDSISKRSDSYQFERIGEWCEKLERVEASIDKVDSIESTVSSISQFLTQHSDNQQVLISPEPQLSSLESPLQQNGIKVEQGLMKSTDQSVITLAYAGVLETGSLVLLSSAQTPTEHNFLPENAIVIVFADRIVSKLEDLWNLMDEEKVPMPRALNLISGPSKTGDIEQTLVYGAHGPKQLHIVLVHGEEYCL